MKYILNPEDFIVEEIINPKFLTKFSRTSRGVKKLRGKYALCLLKKRNMTTEYALQLISRKFGIPMKSIGYAGLKDKFAVTTQFITLPYCEDFQENDISIKKIGSTNKKINIGDLEGNKFTIMLHSFKKTTMLTNLKREHIPNYFGAQRFGLKRNNHIIGKLILQRKYAHTLKKINSNHTYHNSIESVPKDKIKFYLHAYQSYIFNKTLSHCIRYGKKQLKKPIKIIGYNTNAKDPVSQLSLKFIKEDNIKKEDFAFHDLKITCSGSERAAFIKPTDFSCKFEKNKTILTFTLPKGSYGTVVLDYLIKMK